LFLKVTWNSNIGADCKREPGDFGNLRVPIGWDIALPKSENIQGEVLRDEEIAGF